MPWELRSFPFPRKDAQDQPHPGSHHGPGNGNRYAPGEKEIIPSKQRGRPAARTSRTRFRPKDLGQLPPLLRPVPWNSQERTIWTHDGGHPKYRYRPCPSRIQIHSRKRGKQIAERPSDPFWFRFCHILRWKRYRANCSAASLLGLVPESTSEKASVPRLTVSITGHYTG
jgi:hypothetical protein